MSEERSCSFLHSRVRSGSGNETNIVGAKESCEISALKRGQNSKKSDYKIDAGMNP